MSQRNWYVRPNSPTDIERIIATLVDWEPVGGSAAWLQAGDVGWMLRLGREHVASSLVEWRASNGDTGAIALRDNPSSWWFAMDPALFADRSLATEIADWADSIQEGEPLEIGGPWVPAVWRQVFVERGFEATTDAWAQLWKPLGTADLVELPGVRSTSDDRSIADRVSVQRAAFVNSTFTVEKWHEMASEPSFRRELDLLARNDSDEPVAAVTAWMAGVGKCGMLEPMGTHPDHRRQGHGRRVVLAACAKAAQAGASGVCVATPESNSAAVEVYRSAGFRRIGLITAMVRSE